MVLALKRFFSRALIAAFRLESELMRLFYRVTGLKPSSYPFLSGDGFRRLAKWRYEPEVMKRFRPEKIQQDDLIYCKADHVKQFFCGPARRIQRPFRLVSCNADTNVGHDLFQLMPLRLTKWYAQNVIEQHPLVEAIPIGLENRQLHWHGIIADYKRLRRRVHEKRAAILYGFDVSTNLLERQGALAALRQCAVAEPLTQRIDSRAYRRVLVRYRFVASPVGNGLDCHRTWEAMYLGVIPVVKDSVAMHEFEQVGLPMVIVKRWDELLEWDKDTLETLYKEKEKGFDNPALWMDYWQKRIQRAVTAK